MSITGLLAGGGGWRCGEDKWWHWYICELWAGPSCTSVLNLKLMNKHLGICEFPKFHAQFWGIENNCSPSLISKEGQFWQHNIVVSQHRSFKSWFCITSSSHENFQSFSFLIGKIETVIHLIRLWDRYAIM